VGHRIQNGRCTRIIHAELNAITYTDRGDIVGSVAYLTNLPCLRCTQALVNAGVAGIRYIRPRQENSTIAEEIARLAKSANVELVRYDLAPRELMDDLATRLTQAGGILAESPKRR